jgi:hypothetical protein
MLHHLVIGTEILVSLRFVVLDEISASHPEIIGHFSVFR